MSYKGVIFPTEYLLKNTNIQTIHFNFYTVDIQYANNYYWFKIYNIDKVGFLFDGTALQGHFSSWIACKYHIISYHRRVLTNAQELIKQDYKQLQYFESTEE